MGFPGLRGEPSAGGPARPSVCRMEGLRDTGRSRSPERGGLRVRGHGAGSPRPGAQRQRGGRTPRSLPGPLGGSVSMVTGWAQPPQSAGESGRVCGPRPVEWRAVLLSGREDRATDSRSRERFPGCPGLRARQGKGRGKQIPERSPGPHGRRLGALEDLSPGPFQGGAGRGWRDRGSPASPRRSQPLCIRTQGFEAGGCGSTFHPLPSQDAAGRRQHGF